MFSKFRFGERKVSEVEAAGKLAEDEKNSSGGDERCQVPPIDDGTERLTTSQPIDDAADSAPTEVVNQPGDDERADCAAVGSEQEAAAYSAVETNVEGGPSVPRTDQAPGSRLGGGEQASDVLSAGEDEEFDAVPGADDETLDAFTGSELVQQSSLPPALTARRPGRALAKATPKKTFNAEQRLMLLDTWRRSGLPAKDFAALVGISKHTLYKWNQLFEELGPAGLADQPRGQRRGSKLPELTRRTILMLKQSHPEWGCQRISDMLLRGPALPASASAVARVLHEAGYEAVDVPTRPHPDKVRRFERAKPNQLWQTDLFTFVLKRQNRRLHLVAFMDDHSRFIVSYGLHASASTALVIEALEAGIASYGPPEEILTDNGPQYVTWRGKSQFTKQLEKRGIRQIVAKPRRPQTLGKIERFWGTLWREFLEAAVFVDLADARTRIGLFIDYYNLQRVHRGIDGLVPADRFFGAAADVLRTLKERVAANALELAQHGQPQRPFYVTGQVDGKPFSVHSEGERLILRRADGEREEVTLSDLPSPERSEPAALPRPLCPQATPPVAAGEPATARPPRPGQSALDASDVEQAEAKEMEATDPLSTGESSQRQDAEGGVA